MRNKTETIILKNNSRLLGLSLFLVEILGSFSNKEPDWDFEFSDSVPRLLEVCCSASVADRAEQTKSTPLPNVTVIKKTTIFFLYRTTLRHSKLENA